MDVVRVFILLTLTIAIFCGLAAANETPVSLFVSSIRLDGQLLLDNMQLSTILAESHGREMTLAELEELADRITRHYREHGYPFAYAYLPPQEVIDGEVIITVIPGTYGNVVLRNTSKLKDDVAMSLLDPVRQGSIIESSSLQRALLKLNETFGVRAQSAFRAGADPGTSDLFVDLEDHRQFGGRFIVDNQGNPAIGKHRGTVSFELNNPTGSGDRVTVTAINSGPDLFSGNLTYTIAFGSRPNRLTLSYAPTRYQLGGTLAAAKIGGDSRVYRGSFLVPTLRTNHLDLDFKIGLEQRVLEESIFGVVTPKRVLGMDLSLSGERRLTAGPRVAGTDRFSLDLTLGQLHIDDPNAKLKDSLQAQTAGGFTKIAAHMTRHRVISDSWALSGSIDVQWASKNLHESEKMSLGGPGGIRAFKPGEAPGDQGWLVRLDLIRRVSSQFQMVGFVDGGGIWIDKKQWQPAETNSHILFGAGIGLVAAPFAGLETRIEYAWRLGETSLTDEPGRLWFGASWRY